MQSALSRRESILEYLDENRHTTYAALARVFKCSKMTIRRDIEVLATKPYCCPIYLQKGKGGGITVDDSWHFATRRLTWKQQEMLERILPSLQPGDQETARSILSQFGRNRVQAK